MRIGLEFMEREIKSNKEELRHKGRLLSIVYQIALYVSGMTMGLLVLPANIEAVIIRWIWVDLTMFGFLSLFFLMLRIKRRNLLLFPIKSAVKLVVVVVFERPVRNLLFMGFITALYADGRTIEFVLYLIIFSATQFFFMQGAARNSAE